MKKILIIIIVIILGLIAFRSCVYKPQPPTPTPINTTEPVVTVTAKLTNTPGLPTATFVPTSTPTQTSTPVPTSTPAPTLTATPIVLSVITGYENGALHFRYGPGLAYLPKWMSGLGAVYEGDQLEFVTCADTAYPWVMVIFQEMVGFVYGPYVNPVVCQ